MATDPTREPTEPAATGSAATGPAAIAPAAIAPAAIAPAATDDTVNLPARILALDIGNRRIGLALSDPLGITAQPLWTLHRTTERADLKFIARVIRKHSIREVVVGNPLHLSGDISPQARRVQHFAEQLGALAGVTVHLLDERLTTAEAHTLLDRSRPPAHSRSTRREREAVIDQVAAVILLETFLSTRSPRLLPPPPEP